MELQKLYNESFFPKNLIDHTYALERALTQYDKENIYFFADQVFQVLVTVLPSINPELLTWALQILPLPFLEEKYKDKEIINEIITVYKKVFQYPFEIKDNEKEIYRVDGMRKVFMVTAEENERFQEIMLLHISLIFSHIELGSEMPELAEFILAYILTKNCTTKVKIIGAHLILGGAGVFVHTEQFNRFLRAGFESLKCIGADEEVDFTQFDSHFEGIYDNEVFNEVLREKFCDELKLHAKNIGNASLYNYLYSIIDTKLKQPFKHYALVNSMEVYLNLFDESKLPKGDFDSYKIGKFMEEFNNWFSEDLLFKYKPKILFNFLAFGNEDGENKSAIQNIAEPAILQLLEDETEAANLPDILYYFLISNTDFLSREDVIAKIVDCTDKFSESAPILDSGLPQILSILHSVTEITNGKYKEEICNIYSKIIQTLLSGYSFKQDTKRTATFILLSCILSNTPQFFWNFFAKFVETDFFKKHEELIFPYAAISTFIGGELFRDSFNLHERVLKFFTNMEVSDLTTDEFKSVLVNIFALAMGTSFMNHPLDKMNTVTSFLVPRFTDIRHLFNLIDEVSSCGFFTQKDLSRFVGKESVDFSTQTAIISAIDKEIIIRNAVGAIVMNVGYVEDSEEEEFDLPVPEEEEEENTNDESDELIKEAMMYKSKDQFVPYKPVKENRFSDAIKLIKSSHLFKYQMKDKVKHLIQKDIVSNIDSIDPTPVFDVNIAHIINKQEFSLEETDNYKKFMELLRKETIEPLCTLNYRETDCTNDFNGILIIFKENKCHVKRKEEMMAKASEIFVVTLVSEKNQLYSIEILTPDLKDTRTLENRSKRWIPVLLPFFRGMKWLVSGKSMASIIKILSYFSLSGKPELFFKNYIKRSIEIKKAFEPKANSESFQQNKTNMKTSAIFYEFD